MILPHIKQQILDAGSNLAVVVGTGFSIPTSGFAPTASWQGLLTDGLQRCRSEKRVDAPTATRIEGLIASTDVDEWLAGADLIRKKLESPKPYPFKHWFDDAIGSITVVDDQFRDIFCHLRDKKHRIATTNYDHLLTGLTGLQPICSSDGAKSVEWQRRSEEGILHLHGHWRNPDGVVLGNADYTKALHSPTRQEAQKALSTSHTILFVGCGQGGLTDPNIGRLLDWMARTYGTGLKPHYCLCREADVADFRTTFGKQSLEPVSYGADYSDLPGALRDLFGIATAVAITSTPISPPPPVPKSVAPSSNQSGPARLFDSTRPAVPPVFVGREADLLWMTREMEKNISLSLVGSPRIGKTSLLRQWVGQTAATGRKVVLLDGDGPEGEGPGQFVAAVTGAAAPSDPGAAADALAKWLPAHGLPGLPVVIAVDEADGILRRFDRRFFECLRQRLEKDLTLVMATRQSINSIFQENQKGSPFGPRLHTRWVEVLDQPSAEALATQAGAHATLVQDEAGRHPYFIHLLGECLASEPSDDAALRAFRRMAGDRLTAMWLDLDAADQGTLRQAIETSTPLIRDRFRQWGWADETGSLFGRCVHTWAEDYLT